jgi:hypothetical protein
MLSAHRVAPGWFALPRLRSAIRRGRHQLEPRARGRLREPAIAALGPRDRPADGQAEAGATPTRPRGVATHEARERTWAGGRPLEHGVQLGDAAVLLVTSAVLVVGAVTYARRGVSV